MDLQFPISREEERVKSRRKQESPKVDAFPWIPTPQRFEPTLLQSIITNTHLPVTRSSLSSRHEAMDYEEGELRGSRGDARRDYHNDAPEKRRVDGMSSDLKCRSRDSLAEAYMKGGAFLPFDEL